MHFICEILIKHEIVETNKVVETCHPPLSPSTPDAEKRLQAKKEKSKA